MFDHQQAIAEIAHLFQRADQPGVVTLMQTNRRLIEHVQHAGQLAADLRRQPDTLRFATAERPRRTGHCQVIQTDIGQEADARRDLFEHLIGDLLIAFAEC